MISSILSEVKLKISQNNWWTNNNKKLEESRYAQWHHKTWLCGVYDTVELDSAVSMTLWSFFAFAKITAKSSPYAKLHEHKNIGPGWVITYHYKKTKGRKFSDTVISVVEPELEPPFLAGAGDVKKGAAPAPALQLKLQLQLHMTPCLKKRYNKNVNNNVN